MLDGGDRQVGRPGADSGGGRARAELVEAPEAVRVGLGDDQFYGLVVDAAGDVRVDVR